MSGPPFHTFRFEMAQPFFLSTTLVAGMAVSCPGLPSLACTPAPGPLLPTTAPSPSDALKARPQTLLARASQMLSSGSLTQDQMALAWGLGPSTPRSPIVGTVEGQSFGLGKPVPPALSAQA